MTVTLSTRSLIANNRSLVTLARSTNCPPFKLKSTMKRLRWHEFLSCLSAYKIALVFTTLLWPSTYLNVIRLELLKRLIEHEPESVDSLDTDGKSVLHLASATGSTDFVRYLITTKVSRYRYFIAAKFRNSSRVFSVFYCFIGASRRKRLKRIFFLF